MNLEPNSLIVFAGDSVTDSNRDYDQTPGNFHSYGHGYVHLISMAMTAIYPEAHMTVVNAGVNGNTIADLAARWEHDVLALNPDYICILIGINDVWRQFDSVYQKNFVMPTLSGYQATYQHLIDSAKAQAKQVLVVSPFMFETDETNPMRARLTEYQNAARTLAEKNGLPYLDMQAVVNQHLQAAVSYIFTKDGVHPNENGHMLVANAFLTAFGFDWQHQVEG